MKITKAQGRACLEMLGRGVMGINPNIGRAFFQIGYGFGTADCYWFNDDREHYLTALAMCAAIAGVKPDAR